MNKSAEEMVGYEREEVHGKKYYEMNLWSVNDLSKIASLFASDAFDRQLRPYRFNLLERDESLDGRSDTTR